jgi:hypothetical protein
MGARKRRLSTEQRSCSGFNYKLATTEQGVFRGDGIINEGFDGGQDFFDGWL